jgi:hypothetical protein
MAFKHAMQARYVFICHTIHIADGQTYKGVFFVVQLMHEEYDF